MSYDLWVMLTAALVASSCGFIGCFLVLRRLAMVGDAISHSVLLGIVVSFLITHSLGTIPMFIGATLAGLLSTWVMQMVTQGGSNEDAAIGVTFTAFFALGVVLLTLYAGDVHFDTEHVLFGEIAYVPWNLLIINDNVLGPRAVWVIGIVFALSILITGMFFKEFKVCAFDPGLAVAIGLPVTLFHYVQMTLVSMTAVAAFESVGAILTVAMLVVPGTTAYLLTDRLEKMLILSVVIGIVSAVLGYFGAAYWDVSISGSMAVAAGLVFLLAFLFSPKYGVVIKLFLTRKKASEGLV